MKKFLTFLIAGIITLVSCEKSDLNIDAPICIKDKIEVLMNNNVTNPPTQVWKWEVASETYFYITSDCCDQYNILYSENCEVVCAPDGGFTGQGDGKCLDFNEEIVKTLVWKDNRN